MSDMQRDKVVTFLGHNVDGRSRSVIIH